MVYTNNTHQGICESDSAYSNRMYFNEVDVKRREKEERQREEYKKLIPEEKLTHDQTEALGKLIAVICSFIFSLLFG